MTATGLRIHFIKRPSPGFWDILENRRIKTPGFSESLLPTDSVGLIQGNAASVLAAADVAEKAAAIQVAEVRGVCPSHLTMIAVYGDTSAVAAALTAVRRHLAETFLSEDDEL